MRDLRAARFGAVERAGHDQRSDDVDQELGFEQADEIGVERLGLVHRRHRLRELAHLPQGGYAFGEAVRRRGR